MKITIELKGWVPSKKNRLERSKKQPGQRGVHLDKKTQGAIKDLIVQVPSKFRSLGLQHPDVLINLWMSNDREDRDGKVVTLLDILQKTGVIINDNIKWFNGTIRIQPALPCRVGYDASRIDLETY